MHVRSDLHIDGGGVGALAWLSPERMLVVQQIAGERQQLLVVDLDERRVVARHPFAGSVQELARTRHELVILLAPARGIGPASIAVADERGAVRNVRLERIRAGSRLLAGGPDHRTESRLPGLAVDPTGRRLFVIGPTVAAEVDLENLTLAYHPLARKPTSFEGARTDPAASAKQVSGHLRQARWLGDGLLAVSGTDTRQGRLQAAGLLLVDTRNWSVRTTNTEAMSFEIAGDLLLATGGSWDAARRRATGMGLAAYSFDGNKRFQLFDGQQAWLAQVYGGRAYVGIVGQRRLRIVSLRTGRQVGERQSSLPWLVRGVASGWWAED